MTAPTFALSRFASEQNTQPRAFVATWLEFVEMLRVPRRAACTLETCEQGEHLLLDRDGKPKGCRHKYGPAWSPASYPADATRRQQANVIAVALLGVDIDGTSEEILEETLGKVQRYRYVAHATHGDRPGNRNVRIAIPLSRPVSREDWPRFWTAAMATLGVPADTQCCDANRIYFLPSRPSDGEYLFRTGDGEALDVDAILATAEPPAPPPRRPPPAWQTADERIIKRARAYLETLPPSIQGQKGSTTLYNAVAAMMFGFALDESTTRMLIADQYNPRAQPPWSEREIEHKITSVRNTCRREIGYLRDAPDERRRSEWVPSYEPPRPGDLDEEPDLDAFADRDRAPPREWDHVPDDDIPPPDAPPPEEGKRNRPGPRDLAKRYIGACAQHRDGVTLRRWRGDWYRWTAERGSYFAVSDERMDVELWTALPIAKKSELPDVKIALAAMDGVLIDEHDLGDWIGDTAIDSDPLDIAACRNGLLHLPTGKLTPATPRYFATSSLGVAYAPAAPSPERWLAFLRQLWPSSPDSIEALQEWCGYLLTPDTRQQKIALLVGPKRSGKGTIGRIMTALLGGNGNVASPTLASLGTNFGLWPLIGKPAAIIGDARLGTRSDIAQVVERLLSISGEDGQTIDRKHREPWTGRLPTRITIISNELPRFSDASDALPARMLLLELTESFYGREDTGLTDALLAELPGILQWAVEGWRRLRARGHFVQPKASKESIDELADLASPVGAWARQRCTMDEQDPAWWLECGAAYEDFSRWAESNGHHKPSQATFGRDVRAATGCHRVQVRRGVTRVRVYAGLALRSDA